MAERKPKILLIEDEKNLGSTLAERLAQEGFDTQWCQTAEESKQAISQTLFDLALVDVGLPDGSGFDLASKIRSQHLKTALIFLTALGTPEDRIRGLELGAEDYIVKPFHLKELLLRVRNALKRAQYFKATDAEFQQERQIGKAKISFSSFEAWREGKQQNLTQKEFLILKYLLEKKNQAVSRDEILNHIWGQEEFPSSRTIDNFILRLRKLIEEDPENPQIILSVRGIGYLIKIAEPSKKIGTK